METYILRTSLSFSEFLKFLWGKKKRLFLPHIVYIMAINYQFLVQKKQVFPNLISIIYADIVLLHS